MHDCLKITELVDTICSKFDCSYGEDRSALAAAARTCTNFKDPALDHLWRAANLGNLLTYCMPSDLWTVEGFGQWCPATQLRPICDSDWQSVSLYAPRIRTLTSGRGSRDRWSLEAIFPALSLAFPESLLHNLQDLQWYHYDFDFHYIRIFLRPSLTKISFHLSTISHCSLLPSLGERCPKLTDISIAAGPGLDLRPLSRFVARLSLAETICVPWLEQDAVEHLSKLPTLKSLTMGRLPEAVAASAAAIAPAFAGLRHLSLEDGMHADVTQFLQMCRDVPLETLNVALRHFAPTADIHTFLTAITASVSHSTLTRLRFDGGSYSFHKPTSGVHPVHPDTIELLLCFNNLTSLHVTSVLGFDLDDDTVSRMARAWPRMESLYLAGRLFFAPRPRTTLASLYVIARHCPRIFALTLAFDGSDVPSPSPANPRNESLRQLCVLHSPITAPIAMGRCLSGLFPNLNLLTTSRDDMDDAAYAQLEELEEEDSQYHHCWREVWEALRLQPL
ncbi:hypothetical protein DFH06DRAFT_1327184 [Mycena polygramma]|nr:hypothetical protein DFH06DRAFT_1327184 [Mycena polygramma]